MKVETGIKKEGFFNGKQNTGRLYALGVGYQAAIAARGCREGDMLIGICRRLKSCWKCTSRGLSLMVSR